MGKKEQSKPLQAKSAIKGRWTKKENLAYVKFLLQNRSVFQQPGMRKHNHIFLLMAQYLGARTADQCRSHHQKVELYSRTRQVDGIVDYMLKERLSHQDPEVETIKRQHARYLQTANDDCCQKGEQVQKKYRLYTNEKNQFNIVLSSIHTLPTW